MMKTVGSGILNLSRRKLCQNGGLNWTSTLQENIKGLEGMTEVDVKLTSDGDELL
jgi:hypothetical protein